MLNRPMRRIIANFVKEYSFKDYCDQTPLRFFWDLILLSSHTFIAFWRAKTSRVPLIFTSIPTSLLLLASRLFPTGFRYSIPAPSRHLRPLTLTLSSFLSSLLASLSSHPQTTLSSTLLLIPLFLHSLYPVATYFMHSFQLVGA